MSLQKLKEEVREELTDFVGKDSPLKKGFFDRRVEAFSKSLDGNRWIYRFKDDDDDEDNWYPLKDIECHLEVFINEIIDRTRTATLEEVKGMTEKLEHHLINESWARNINPVVSLKEIITKLLKLKNK